MKTFVEMFKYQEPAALFEALAHLPYSLFLDSADRKHADGRYSFICCYPIETIESKNGSVTVTNRAGQETMDGDPFAIVKKRIYHWGKSMPTIPGLPPFQGGAAGLFGYDLGRDIEILPSNAEDNAEMPDMAVGIYDQVIGFDHVKEKAWIITHADDEAQAVVKREFMMKLLAAKRDGNAKANDNHRFAPEWTSNFTVECYEGMVEKVRDYIRDGDIFQANLSQKFRADVPETFDAYTHYQTLRRINPAPFGLYMNLGPVCISSASPERFLKVNDRRVETRPIKGTMARSGSEQKDRLLRNMLENSQKDRSENIMIVDLLRNDLSKVCVAESVEVTELCKIESFSAIHHMVSTVKGYLRKGETAVDLLRACFPGGSITGAPKIRAMEIIDELEDTRRGPYCGSLAYIGFDGRMDSNILIRTLVYQDNSVSLQVGGGITLASKSDQEYQETLDKASGVFKSFEPAEDEKKDLQEAI